jgi:peptide/nickel transport system permease protein
MTINELPIWQIKWQLFWERFKRNWIIFREAKIGVIGLIIIVIFGGLAAFYPLWVGRNPDIYDPHIGFDPAILRHPSPPSLTHPLGTDLLGRDILSQLMYGTRIAFTLGIIAASFTAVIATLIGAVCAYYRGIVDTFFMRLANLVMLFPFLAFIPVLSAIMEITALRFALVVGLLSGFGGATLILKSRAMSVVVKPYVEAAKVAGGSDLHIVITHIIPNILPLSFLYMMFTVQGAIFSEAILSWLGFLHIRMSWGIMLYTASRAGYLVGAQLSRYWWVWLPAGMAITLLCAGFYLFGRGMDEVINPRLRRR